MENRGKSSLVENPNEHFYTLEDVAKHASKEDCWTILNGRIYDVTEYAKVHPGGTKIFLGKGKDCTKLYNEYHPWVNGAVLIGKYQVGVLKN
jgi:cytochrome-b5 reductase